MWWERAAAHELVVVVGSAAKAHSLWGCRLLGAQVSQCLEDPRPLKSESWGPLYFFFFLKFGDYNP